MSGLGAEARLGRPTLRALSGIALAAPSGSEAWAWIVALAATGCAFGLSAAAGLRVAMEPLLPLAVLATVLAILSVVYARVRPAPVLSTLLGTVAATTWSLLMVGIIALAALGSGARLIDPALAAADAAFGLDARAAVEAASEWPNPVALLGIAYQSSVPLVFLTLVCLAVTGRHAEAWRFVSWISASAVACAMISALLPAIGAFVTLGVPPEVLARLPAGAGVYHLPVFDAFREGRMRTIDVRHLEGVVTFPSFHTAMAIATTQAWRVMRPFAGIALAWNALVISSTIVVGGHYFVDLAAGAAVFALIHAATRGRRARPADLALDSVGSRGVPEAEPA